MLAGDAHAKDTAVALLQVVVGARLVHLLDLLDVLLVRDIVPGSRVGHQVDVLEDGGEVAILRGAQDIVRAQLRREEHGLLARDVIRLDLEHGVPAHDVIRPLLVPLLVQGRQLLRMLRLHRFSGRDGVGGLLRVRDLEVGRQARAALVRVEGLDADHLLALAHASKLDAALVRTEDVHEFLALEGGHVGGVNVALVHGVHLLGGAVRTHVLAVLKVLHVVTTLRVGHGC